MPKRVRIVLIQSIFARPAPITPKPGCVVLVRIVGVAVVNVDRVDVLKFVTVEVEMVDRLDVGEMPVVVKVVV